MEFLEYTQYQYGVGLEAVVDPISERFSTAELEIMLEQRETDLFIKIDPRSLSYNIVAVAYVLTSLLFFVSLEPSELYSPVG